jgi:hypothetical protein
MKRLCAAVVAEGRNIPVDVVVGLLKRLPVIIVME